MMDAGCDVSESVTVGVVIQVGALIGILGISDLTARLPVTVTAALLMCFGIIAMTVFSLALSQVAGCVLVIRSPTCTVKLPR